MASVAAGRWCCPYRRSVRSRPRRAMRPPTCVSAHGRVARRASALLRDFWRPATGKCTYSHRISPPCEREIRVLSTGTCVESIFTTFRALYRRNRHLRRIPRRVASLVPRCELAISTTSRILSFLLLCCTHLFLARFFSGKLLPTRGRGIMLARHSRTM